MTDLLARSDYGCLLPILVGVAVIAISLYTSHLSKRLKNTCQALAARLGGTMIDGGFWSNPHVQFTLGGRSAVMEFYAGSKNSPPYARVVVGLGGRSPGTLHILPDGFGQSFLKLFGAQDLEVGDRAFDAAYVVKAKPESLAAQVFSPDRRRQVMASVRRLAGFRHPTISLNHQSLTVEVREYLLDVERLWWLKITAEEFLGYLFGTPSSAGIQFGEVRVAAGGVCPVCGTPMTDLVVRCESCRTPHHSECWQYMSRCSTYACKGKRAIA